MRGTSISLLILIEDPLHVKTLLDIEVVTAHIGNLSEKFSIRVQLRGLRRKREETRED